MACMKRQLLVTVQSHLYIVFIHSIPFADILQHFNLLPEKKAIVKWDFECWIDWLLQNLFHYNGSETELQMSFVFYTGHVSHKSIHNNTTNSWNHSGDIPLWGIGIQFPPNECTQIYHSYFCSILVFFPKVSEFDDLPNFICVDCWMTVKKFHEFYQNVRNAQNRFLGGINAIVKLETENHYEEISYADACK